MKNLPRLITKTTFVWLPKIHKINTPLKPILSRVGSDQHNLTGD